MSQRHKKSSLCGVGLRWRTDAENNCKQTAQQRGCLKEPGEAFRTRRSISKAREDYMPQYSFNIESDGCHFDLKGASFLDEKTAEQFARRLCTFFHPKLWSPTVVMCDGDGKEVF